MIDVVMHVNTMPVVTMVVSCKIARFIGAELSLPVLHLEDESKLMLERCKKEGLANFIIVNSPTGFSEAPMRDLCAQFHHIAENTIFVQNDYKMRPASQCKSYCLKHYGEIKGEAGKYYGMNLWTTVPNDNVPYKYINWNMLTYNDDFIDRPFSERKEGIVYWGALRGGREENLNRLLNGDFTTTISTNGQSIKKFEPHVDNAVYIGKMANINETLSNYKATIYMQDKASDKLYCSLANRFYEALGSGIAIFIDSRATNTFDMANMPYKDEWVVDTDFDVELLLPYAERIAKEQKELWCKDYKQILIDNLNDLYWEL